MPRIHCPDSETEVLSKSLSPKSHEVSGIRYRYRVAIYSQEHQCTIDTTLTLSAPEDFDSGKSIAFVAGRGNDSGTRNLGGQWVNPLEPNCLRMAPHILAEWEFWWIFPRNVHQESEILRVASWVLLTVPRLVGFGIAFAIYKLPSCMWPIQLVGFLHCACFNLGTTLPTPAFLCCTGCCLLAA